MSKKPHNHSDGALESRAGSDKTLQGKRPKDHKRDAQSPSEAPSRPEKDPSKPKSGRRTDIDWGEIGRFLASGGTMVEASKKFGVSVNAIKYQKQHNLKLLAPKARKGAKTASILAEAALIQQAGARAAATQKAIDKAVSEDLAAIEETAKNVAGIISSHRTEINSLRGLAATLFEELTAVCGKPMELALLVQAVANKDPLAALELRKLVSLPSRIGSMDKLASIADKLIGLERQAYGLDKDQAPKDPLHELTDVQLGARFAYLMGKAAGQAEAEAEANAGAIDGEAKRA